MKIKDISNVLEEFAPLAFQESYDNSGLLVGNQEWEASAALLCLDVTEEVLEEAISKSCNLIIAHHPLIFGGIKKLNGANYVERIVIKAIQNNIAIYACHTNIDHVKGGVNQKICEKLGLKNLRILSPKNDLYRKLVTFVPSNHLKAVKSALFAAGAGHIGEYSNCSFSSEGKGTFKASEQADPYVGTPGMDHEEPEVKLETIYPIYVEARVLEALHLAHPYEEVAYDVFDLKNKFGAVGSGMVGELEEEVDAREFLEQIKKQLKADCIRYTVLPNKKVKKVAVCGGSGSFLLKEAIRSGADVFVSSDFKYHQFFDAENKLVIADVGHYETEQFTSEIFYDIITKKFPTFAVRFSEINTNPINYLI